MDREYVKNCNMKAVFVYKKEEKYKIVMREVYLVSDMFNGNNKIIHCVIDKDTFEILYILDDEEISIYQVDEFLEDLDYDFL